MKNTVAVILLSMLISCGSKFTATDSNLINNFNVNKQYFYKYVDLFANHNGLTSIEAFHATTGVMLMVNVDLPSNITENEVLKDMKEKLGVDLISVHAFKDAINGPVDEISFYSYRVGLVTGGRVKGISYFKYSKPKVIEPNLSKYDPPQNARFPDNIKRVYTAIGDGWYLFSGLE